MSTNTEYATGTRVYTTKEGTYNLDLSRNQVTQQDVNALDQLQASGELRQASLVRFMQKYEDVFLVNSQGRELDSPSDMLKEDPDYDGMYVDVNTIFADAVLVFARAAQKFRQSQMEMAQAASKEMMVQATEEKNKELAAAKANQKAGWVEGGIGIGSAVLGAAGGVYGGVKTFKAQKSAGLAKKSTTEIHKLKTETADSQTKLQAHAESTTKKLDAVPLQSARRKEEVQGLARQKDVEIETAKKDQADLEAKRNKSDTDHRQLMDEKEDAVAGVKPTAAIQNKIDVEEANAASLDRQIDKKKNEITHLKFEKKNFENEAAHPDISTKPLTDKHQAEKAKHAELVRKNDAEIDKHTAIAAAHHADAETHTSWTRVMGGTFNALSTGANMSAKGGAAEYNLVAQTNQAEGKFDAAQKEAASINQSLHTDLAGSAREHFNEALAAARQVMQQTQETANSAANKMA